MCLGSDFDDNQLPHHFFSIMMGTCSDLLFCSYMWPQSAPICDAVRFVINVYPFVISLVKLFTNVNNEKKSLFLYKR